MKDFFHHYFLPHHTNNQRPKLLHYDALFLLAVVVMCATLLFINLKKNNRQVLGTSIGISTQELLQLTNQERQKNGLSALVMNSPLTRAAQLKAKDMFEKNYWAHNSPSGTMPWDFIKQVGYDYQYAGENLARGFTSGHDVVTAWMHSPEHRENMLSPNYHDVGFALQQGNLTGEADTILIVEELGSTAEYVPQMPTTKTLGSTNKQQVPLSFIQKNPLIDSRFITKNIALSVIFLFIVILIVDLLIIKRKKIVRFVSHNLDHVLFLATTAIVIVFLQIGAIL